MSFFISGLIFLAIFLLVYKAGMNMSSQEKLKKKRFSEFANTDDDFLQLKLESEEEKTKFSVLLENLARPLRGKSSDEETIKAKLASAGVVSPNSYSKYLFYSTYGWVIGVVLSFLIYQFAMQEEEGTVMYASLFLALLALIYGVFGAKFWVDAKITERKKKLTRSFPDALDLLLICVESGLALDAALARVCKELKFAHPLITEELNRTRLELTLLNDREKALNNLALRTDLLAFKALVSALLQSEKFGTSLVETLRVLSDDFRQTRLMKAEEKAAKLDPKITAVTVPFMIAALLILILTPAMLELGKNWKPVEQDQKQRAGKR
jgi:tight adherence protein C